ncbi:MAG: chorismate synthase [Bacteroidales bacterium]|nr:chorismate synthase [Bacteroidales bacterium]
MILYNLTMNTFGKNFRVSIFGESHGEKIGVVIDGVRPGIGLVADELKANGNPPAQYIFTEPSSFKVIVKSADPHSEQIRTNPETPKTDLSGSRTNERTNSNKSLEDRLIEIVRVNSTISKTSLAHELGIGRTKLYELLNTMTHRVRSTGGTRHVEWTVLED